MGTSLAFDIELVDGHPTINRDKVETLATRIQNSYTYETEPKWETLQFNVFKNRSVMYQASTAHD